MIPVPADTYLYILNAMTIISAQPAPRLLVVEDDSLQQKQLVHLLLSFGYPNVVLSHSAEDSLEKIAQCPPDLILTNHQFSGRMTGSDLAERIRTRFDIPVIMVTGTRKKDIPAAVLQRQGVHLLPKPYLSFQLPLYIEMALGEMNSNK